MTKLRIAVLTPLLFATSLLPAYAQHNNNAYYNGMRNGERGGRYYSHNDRRYHGGYYQQDQGGIGPGKGALIGAAGGALLGAAFGGGLQGTIVAGAAGAGIGAVIGQSAQDNRRRDRYGRPY
jgi:hypothetical protein